MRTETIKVHVPDGWELMTDELRLGYFTYHRFDGEQNLCGLAYPQIILRKIEEWKQPDFLKPGWIAMDADGSWWWYRNIEPDFSIMSNRWGNEVTPMRLNDLNWTPPVCDDWKKSKRKIN